MKSNVAKIALIGVVHPNMPGNDREVFRQVTQSLEVMKTAMGFELVVWPELLGSEEEAEKACRFVDDQRVDFTFIFNASLGAGRVLLPLARMNSAIGLWSVPEPTTCGVLQLNSFCGLNMYGAILGKYFDQYQIPFKWFYGYPDSELFQERFQVTLRAMQALKAAKNARIALVGGIANGFENIYFDERVMEKTFGSYIQTRHSVEEIVARARSVDESRVNAELETIGQEGTWNIERVNREDMEKFARVYLAFRDFAEENRYDALCISCWPRFQEVYGIAVCGAMSRLNQFGIVAPCEGDVPGALNMLMFNAMNGGKATMSDLVSLDEEDQSINMWHCGVAPGCWADEQGISWDEHFNIGSYVDGSWKGKGVVADLTFKPGLITVCRMDSTFDHFFLMTGQVMPDKNAYYGSSGWINDVRMSGEALSLKDLMNTIAVHRIDHHYPMAYGDLSNEVREIAAWKKLKVLDPVPYTPHLQP